MIFLQVKECINNFNVYENNIIMEGYLDDILDFEPVTEGVKDVAKKVIDFIKEVWRKIKEWFKKVIGHFRKQESAKAECEAKIKQANEKAEAAPKAEPVKKDNRSAREIYKEKSSKTRAARRNCYSVEEVLHNSNLKVKLFIHSFKLSELPANIKDTMLELQDACDALVSGEMELEKFDNVIAIDGEIGKKMTKISEKVEAEQVNVKDHVDFIMSVINDKDDVIKALQQIEKDNDNIMNGYIKMCQNISQGAEEHFDAVVAKIKKALNLSTQVIKDGIGSIGRLFGTCNGIIKKATAEYVASLAPYKE